MKVIMRHILIVAGDPSADRHGANLIAALRKRNSTLRISALGGDHLRKSADNFLISTRWGGRIWLLGTTYEDAAAMESVEHFQELPLKGPARSRYSDRLLRV